MAQMITAPAEQPDASVDALTWETQESASPEAKVRQQKSLWQLLNLSIGFLGIQFGWAIQMGQMGPLLETLGSDPRLTSLFFLAGPVTGVLVQPIVGSMSDRCQSRWGRRRPFLLVGALLIALSLILMPNSPNLITAAILLWILDASLNITQGPYRALVPDTVPRNQQGGAYSLMSLTIGLGSVAAFGIGYLIPSMKGLFYLGAASILLAMGWTILTNKEVPERRPEGETAAQKQSLIGFFTDTWQSISTMPAEAKKLCLTHSFTWFGLGCLFFFFALYVPHNVFGVHVPGDPLYQKGVQWASLCYAVLNGVCFFASAFISKLCLAGASKRAVHTVGLLAMAVSMTSMFFITDPVQVMIAMGLLGVGWATTLSIPFAMLSEHLPSGNEGVLMGAFNMFIAAPQVVTSLVVGQIIMMADGNYAVALLVGGASMLVSAVLLQQVKEHKPDHAYAATTP
jgi:maltose/moltooligosaccharide transporter